MGKYLAVEGRCFSEHADVLEEEMATVVASTPARFDRMITRHSLLTMR
jgi:hypothetical protein